MSNVLDAIYQRRSCRAYTSEPLTPDQVDALIKAALSSPSAVNSQPWHFTFVHNQALLDRMNQAVRRQAMKDPQNASSRFAGEDFHVFYHAPTVVFLSADSVNPLRYGQLDCGIAVENLALAAQGLGLGSVILGMPREAFSSEEGDEFRRLLRFPKDYDFKITIAIGHSAMTKEAHPVKENLVDIVT